MGGLAVAAEVDSAEVGALWRAYQKCQYAGKNDDASGGGKEVGNYGVHVRCHGADG